jgi:NADH:ubiquinone oxidoreductase subunit 5 (subunit L)/multisubunit Na+/H+ antiporter MnhA subunit
MLVAFFYGTMDRFLLQNGHELEFPVLIVFIAGSALIIFYVHTLVEFLLALETLTLASYALAGYERQNRHSTYASVQYFILGAIPSGILIFGIGLLYSQSGVMSFEDLDLISYQNSSISSKNYLAFFQEELNSGSITTLTNVTLENNLNALAENLNLIENNVSGLVNELISTRTTAFLAGILFILFNL